MNASRRRLSGFSDGQIVGIIAVTAENIFTNLLNVVAETDIDFPVVKASEADPRRVGPMSSIAGNQLGLKVSVWGAVVVIRV